MERKLEAGWNERAKLAEMISLQLKVDSSKTASSANSDIGLHGKALALVFIYFIPPCVIAFVLLLFLKQDPLKTTISK